MDQAQPGVATRDRAEHTQFAAILALILGAYLLISVAYTLRLPMAMDEFQGAHAIHQLTHGIPYRDFLPYKTVLGYYTQWPFLSIEGDLWTRMLAVKVAMAGLTAVALAFVSFRLRRWFDDVPILLSLTMLVFHSTFLERSAELRVDMLTAIAGLFGLTALVSGASVAAGLLTGLAFVVSQKGVYYVLAALCALLAIRRSGTESGPRGQPFVLACGGVLIVYLAVFSLLADPLTVLRAVFLSPARVAFAPLYDIHAEFWLKTLQRNPGFYAWSVASLLLVWFHRTSSWRLQALAVYGSALTVLIVLHRQPWPYFFVLLLPTLFVVDAAALHLLRPLLSTRRWRLLGALLVLTAILLPLLRVPVVMRRDNTLQRRTVAAASEILGADDRYVAGIEMIWHREQSVDELRWLDGTAVTALRRAPLETKTALGDLVRSAPTKVVIQNYRLRSLPPLVRSALESDFGHWSDCMYVYAPKIEEGPFWLNLSGDYMLDASSVVRIDSMAIRPGESRRLERGRHVAETTGPVHLRLVPANAPPPDPDRPCGELFPNVHGF